VLVGNLHVGFPAPQRKRASKERYGTPGVPACKRLSRLGGYRLETLRIRLLGLEDVAGCPREQDFVGTSVPKGLPQPRDVDVQALRPTRRGLAAPQLVDQAVAGDDLARVHEQQRQ
jgi:hypothetical protein